MRRDEQAMRLGMSIMRVMLGTARMEGLLECMSNERGRRVDFWLFIVASLSLSLSLLVPSVPFPTLAVLN